MHSTPSHALGQAESTKQTSTPSSSAELFSTKGVQPFTREESPNTGHSAKRIFPSIDRLFLQIFSSHESFLTEFSSQTSLFINICNNPIDPLFPQIISFHSFFLLQISSKRYVGKREQGMKGMEGEGNLSGSLHESQFTRSIKRMAMEPSISSSYPHGNPSIIHFHHVLQQNLQQRSEDKNLMIPQDVKKMYDPTRKTHLSSSCIFPDAFTRSSTDAASRGRQRNGWLQAFFSCITIFCSPFVVPLFLSPCVYDFSPTRACYRKPRLRDKNAGNPP